jgi:Skp family chaperone for outer membrane proteins
MRLKSILSAAAVAVAVTAIVAPDASAQRNRNQGGGTVVLNYERVLSESALGRDMQQRLNQVRTQIGAEAQALQPEGQAIEQERERLATATRSMTPQQIQNSSTYRPQFEQLSQRLQQFQLRGQTLQGDFECTQLIALRDFRTQSEPVVRSVMQSRGAAVVLSANGVQMFQPDSDITTAVIQALDGNQATRTSTVARRAVAECQAQQPAQPPAQAPAGQ